jgi:hypothetical protein
MAKHTPVAKAESGNATRKGEAASRGRYKLTQHHYRSFLVKERRWFSAAETGFTSGGRPGREAELCRTIKV